MSDIARAARLYWRLLNRQCITREEYALCLNVVFGDHNGSPTHYLVRRAPETVNNSIFQRQPETARLLTEWAPRFAQPGAIDTRDAGRFILAIYNAAEDVNELFASTILPGTTRHVLGTLSDYITRHPRTKLGWTVQLTTEGRGAYNCVREQLSTKPGDLILFSPDALYDYRRAADNSVWEVEWVYFPQQPQWLDLLRWPEVGPGIHRVHAAGADYDRLRGLFTEIYEIHLAEPPLSQRLVSNLLEQLLIRCSQLAPVARNPPTDKRVLKAMDMIARRFAENFTVEELAAGCGMSAPRLAALFRRQTGMTIKQWRDERRMARATQLLVQTASPITRVAQDVGYGDSLYFSRCFNSRFGCSPRAWREQRLRDREFEPLARN